MHLCVSVGTHMHASVCGCIDVSMQACVCAEGTGETQALILLRASTDVES